MNMYTFGVRRKKKEFFLKTGEGREGREKDC